MIRTDQLSRWPLAQPCFNTENQTDCVISTRLPLEYALQLYSAYGNGFS